jgi:hypothetical protein
VGEGLVWAFPEPGWRLLSYPGGGGRASSFEAARPSAHSGARARVDVEAVSGSGLGRSTSFRTQNQQLLDTLKLVANEGGVGILGDGGEGSGGAG